MIRTILAFALTVPSFFIFVTWLGYCLKQTLVTQDWWFSALVIGANLTVWLSLGLLIEEKARPR